MASSSISIPTGKHSTNYKAEAEALQARVLANSEATYNTKVVLLTDARSVLESLESTKCPELNALTKPSWHSALQRAKLSCNGSLAT